MENLKNNDIGQSGTELNLRDQIEIYLRRWPWFVLAVLVSLTIGYLYLRYTTYFYQTKTSIIIKDSRGLGAASEYAAFQDIGMLSGMNANSIENEMAILRSKSLLTNVARELNLGVSYYTEGRIKTTEVYSQSPFEVIVMDDSQKAIFPRYLLEFRVESETTFEIYDPEQKTRQKYNFGERVSLPFTDITVIPKLNTTEYKEYPYTVQVGFRNIQNVVSAYQRAIQISPIDRMSSVIELTLNDPVRDKAEKILNSLVKEYNNDAIRDRNIVIENTVDFIEERLDVIFGELDSVETDKVEFKMEHRLTDIDVESGLFMRDASELQKKLMDVEVQLKLIEDVTTYLSSDEEIKLFPTNLGISGEGLVGLVNNYNELVLRRNSLLLGATESNPFVVALTGQIKDVRSNVLSSLGNVKNSLQITLNDLKSQEALIGSRMSQVPGMEKTYRDIERQQGIKEALYLFLLQKREESAISLAVNAPKAKVIDEAYSSFGPVSPKRNIILLAAFLLGLLIPFGIIYLGQLLYNKISNRKDIEQQTKEIPIVGEVPKLHRSEAEIIGENDRSILAESFRIMRTNLSYLLAGRTDEDGGKSIFVTSTVKGEGKTFVAFNLALTLASSNKKVLAIGLDIRNPQFHRFVKDAKRKKGVTDYLVSNDAEIEEYIEVSQYNKNLDVLYSGSIPPNPAELLMTRKIGEMFDKLKEQYDYVIVDTAPSMLVTDTFLISRYADVTLYVVRADYTEKRLLEFSMDAVSMKKLNNTAYVLNNIKMSNFGYYGSKYYGYGYGYAYGVEKKDFMTKVRRFLRV